MDPFDPKEIAEAITQGQKNKRNLELISNWCSHAQLDRFGGIGLIEQLHQVPIGSVGVKCENGRAGGSYGWDLGNSFLEFYRRNCKSCQVRRSVRQPDIQPLIDRYEAKVAQHEQNQAEAARTQLTKLDARRQARERLRSPTNVLSNEVVDLIDEVDAHACSDAGKKLAEMARLAPEAFSPDLRAHLTGLIAAEEPRLALAAYGVIVNLDACPLQGRLALSTEILKRKPEHLGAADFIGTHADQLDPASLEDLLPRLARLAKPARGIMSYQSPHSDPLIAVTRARLPETIAFVGRILGDGGPGKVLVASQIIATIGDTFPSEIRRFGRQILSLLLRRRTLLPEFENRHANGLVELRDAAVAVWKSDPLAADKLLQSLLQGGDDIARTETAKLYARSLDVLQEKSVLEPTEINRTAFKRLLWAAVEDVGVDLDSRAIAFFRRPVKKLAKIAATEIDSLLGAAATLSERYAAIGKPNDQIIRPKTFLDQLNVRQKRSSIDTLQGELISWAIVGATELGVAGVESILALYTALPDEQEQMRANMVAHFGELITSPDSMNAVLPQIYRALTDDSVLIRASAGQAVGSTNYHHRRNFPELIFELYLVHLSDPFVMVHKGAVKSLHLYDFPENLKRSAIAALVDLINTYRRSRKDDNFLVSCLGHYVNNLTDAQIRGDQGRAVIALLNEIDEMEACAAMDRGMGVTLVEAPGAVDLMCKLILSEWNMDRQNDPLLEHLQTYPRNILIASANSLVELGKKLGEDDFHKPLSIIFLLVRIACPSAAKSVVDAILPTIPDNRREKVFRDLYGTIKIACDLEASLPPNLEQVQAARAAWDQLFEDIDKDAAEADETRDISPIFLSQIEGP
ncbi:hypothetical protein [Asticcacaulis sp. W401b]|uniref:hypothetical protein n=1 Tax=Asticcacaulis sp. W401b TaxID=3388666 RepID=UPI003970D5BF